MLNRYFRAGEDNIDFMYANIAVENIYFALISLEYLFDDSKYSIGLYHDEVTYCFFHIQSVLTACGNITNTFYNSNWRNKEATARCKRLRNEFGITRKEFPLVFMKEVRNTNEHFDERYEYFKGNLGDNNILGIDSDKDFRTTVQQNPHLRTFDRSTNIYYTYVRCGTRLIKINYDVMKLRDELTRMLEQITTTPLFESAWVDRMPTESVE